MKKIIIGIILAIISIPSSAWDDSKFSFGISGYTTNYYAAVLYNIIASPVYEAIYEDYDDDSFAFNVIPNVAVMFAIPVNNTTQETVGKIYSPYKKCLKEPWKDMGDYSIGIDFSYDHMRTPFGVYVGCNYKSSEVVTSELNHRAHYISPKAGLRLRYEGGFLVEVGGSYDFAFKYSGNYQNSKNCVNSGFNANFALGYWFENGSSIALKYEHPLYNFFNEDFSQDGGLTHPFEGVNRRTGYISISIRRGF